MLMLKPVTLAQANEFVAQHHRHHNKRYMNLTEKIFTRSVIDRTFFVYCKVKRKGM